MLVAVIVAVWYLGMSNFIYFLPTPHQPLSAEALPLAQHLWENPQPTTDVFKGIELRWRVDTGTVLEICVALSQFHIWEPGDFGEVVHSPVLKVNNVVLHRFDTIISAVAIGITRFENGLSGKPLGSHGGPMSVCFRTDNIPDGLNLAELHFQSTSGKVYDYNWAFKLSRENQIIHVELPNSIWLYKNPNS